MVSRNRIEKIIISVLKTKILTSESLEYIYQNIEKTVAEDQDGVPKLIKKKKAQNEEVMSELQNYLNFTKIGNLSKAVSQSLSEVEQKSDDLKQEIKALEFQKKCSFKAPLKEWIDQRLEKQHETLSRKTLAAAIALQEFLGTIQLEPVASEELGTCVQAFLCGTYKSKYPCPPGERYKGSSWW